MRKFSCEKEKRARDRQQKKSDESGNETERETGKEEGRGEKRREGKREEKKRTTTENEDLPPAAALAALRVPTHQHPKSLQRSHL